MNPFHSWLLRQPKHRYCSHRGCLMKLEPSTKIVKINGQDYAYCDWHAKGKLQQGLEKRYKMMMGER